jgi:hypothetical protein
MRASNKAINREKSGGGQMTPFDLSSLGKFLLIGAVVLAIVGILLMILGNIPFFGRLPGDIAIWRNGNTFFFPIVTCLVLSVVLTIVINVILWIFRR